MFRFLMCLFMAVLGWTAWADVNIHTTIRTLRLMHTDERAGSIRFTVDNNDFDYATVENPMYIRLTIDHNALLTRTLVDVEGSFQGHHPIFLAVSTPRAPGVQLSLGPEDVAIVRWRKQERKIWIRVSSSSRDWLSIHGNASAPTQAQPVSFSIGLTARESENHNTSLYFDRFANRRGNSTGDDQSSDTQLRVNLSQSNLENHATPHRSILSFDPIAFQFTEAVTTTELSSGINPGVGQQVNFSNDTRIGDAYQPIHRQYLPWIPASGSYETLLSLTNTNSSTTRVTFTARNPTGQDLVAVRDVNAMSGLEISPYQLFPQITQAFALQISHDNPTDSIPITLSLTGSETGDTRVIDATPVTSKRLVLPFRKAPNLKTTLFLLNTGNSSVPMRLRLLNANGSAAALPHRGLLEPGVPKRLPLNIRTRGQGSFSVLVEADSPLVGAALITDGNQTPNLIQGQPTQTTIAHVGGGL